MKKLNRENKIRLLAVCIFIIASVVMTVLAVPFIKNLVTEEGRAETAMFIRQNGAAGVAVFLFFQILQIIIAFIPGEPLEIIAGMLFGTWGGLALCLSGIFIGTMTVYFMTKRVGRPLAYAIIGKDKLEKPALLNNEKRLEMIVFLLFLIPGTPKDALTYIIPLTKIKPARYFTLATLARIPSVVSSTLVGATMSKGNWLMSILLFAATIALGIAGILLNNRINKTEKDGHNEQEE